MHKLGYILIAIWFSALVAVGLSVNSACNQMDNNSNLFVSIGGR